MWLAPSPLFAKGAAKLNVADVFSTTLYTGNSAARTITNGIDLAAKGGLVWLKSRSFTESHGLFDTQRGASLRLASDLTSAESTLSGVTAFNSDGFNLGGSLNSSGQTYVAWSFRKAPKFFDVVTYTGDGVAGRTVAHGLGVAPGMIIVKERNGTDGWIVYHRSNTASPETQILFLNGTNSTLTFANVWNNTAPTPAEFTLGNNNTVNQAGQTYVAYLFAHDPDPAGLIQCLSYTTDASGNGSLSPGYDVQFVMVKATTATSNWEIYDVARTPSFSGSEAVLRPNLADGEVTASRVSQSGGTIAFTGLLVSQTHIVMLIRAEGA